LLVLALSGVLVAWERPLYWIARARPEHEPPLPHSAPPAHGSAGGAGVDAWLAAAGRALPGLAVDRLWMPSTARSAVQVRMRERDGFERSVVYLDRYDARLLRVDAAASGPRAFRAHVLNRAIHTGDVAGWPSRGLAVFASLAVAVLSGTGAVLWVKKLVR
jgi:uncharacterized iron-regulated membrane protein